METKKLGHQATKGYRVNEFNYIGIRGDFSYCLSHNFVYDLKAEREKLANGLPCHYTDGRFYDSRHNYFKQAYLYWSRWKWKQEISLRSCIRRTLSCKNIPVGTIVEFQKDWYNPDRKEDGRFLFEVRKENKLSINYEINKPSYKENFSSCEFSRKLTDALRGNGFIVSIKKDNVNFLSSMIATAASYQGSVIEPIKEQGEIAFAFGHGKKIGFSSKNNTFMGYACGQNSILWDEYEEFNKWSQCAEIPKTTSIDDIVEILKTKS